MLEKLLNFFIVTFNWVQIISGNKKKIDTKKLKTEFRTAVDNLPENELKTELLKNIKFYLKQLNRWREFYVFFVVLLHW